MNGLAFVCGMVMVAVGAGLVFFPAGLIVGGFLVCLAALLSYRGSDVRVDS